MLADGVEWGEVVLGLGLPLIGFPVEVAALETEIT